MILFVYDKYGNQTKTIKWVNEFVHDDEIGNLDFIEFVLIGDTVDKYDYLVWRDEFNVWHEHFVREVTLIHSEGAVVQKVYAVNSVAELNLSYIDERDSYNFKNSVAWSRLLENTRWTSGTINDLGLNDVKFYHETIYDGIVQILDIWGGDLSTSITVGANGVTARMINHEKQRGEDNGLLFTYGFDMDNIERKIELDDVYTKIHVFGKGEPTYDDEGNQTGNGRRISFKDINGGKDYVEDNDAKSKWGIQGKNGWQHSEGTFVYDQVEDPSLLLEMAKAKLVEVSQPRITYSANVAILKAAGMEFKNARTGDICYIRDKVLDERLNGRIIHVRRFVDKPTEVTLGNIVRTVSDIFKDQQKQISNLTNSSPNWNGIAEANREWLKKMMDNLNDEMNKTGGFVYWEEGEGITVYDRKIENNPTMAIQLKGAGFRIANKKKSNGEWDWRTFGTGDGFTADVINVGTLKCGENTINLDSGLINLKNGVIQDMYSNNYLNLGTGEFRLAFNTKVGDKTVQQIAQDEVDAELNNFVSQVYDPKISDLQKQIDGQIETWYFDYEPKLTNKPASDWNTEAKKEAHEGDLFYWRSKGYAYRFFKDGSTWVWQMVQDTDITRALAGAAAAQDTADSKRRVFVSQPVPPYDVGDLWAQGKSGDLKRCATARKEGASFYESDWVLATKYTDDSALDSFISGEFQDTINEIESQADKKAETWFQNTNPATSWTSTTVKKEHTGDLWYNPDTNEYKRWSGTAWENMTVIPPKSVFDEIDGKAQIFVAEPVPPYQVGDLWVQGSTGDILRCQRAKSASQTYAASDWIKASKYTDDSALSTFLTGDYKTTVEEIKGQIDGKIETWYQTTNPATDWKTAAQKSEHVGDLWFNTSDNSVKRWSGTAWVEMDVDPPSSVFDQIDGKAQIFVNEPTTPYDIGDVWFEGTSGDILVSTVKRTVSQSFTKSDWKKRNKYTDDSALSSFIDGQFKELEGQVDDKIETWYQSASPSTSWNSTALKNEHIGDLWYNTSNGLVKRWNGTSWEDITTNPPKAVFDEIDGKAQIFTGATGPKPPYSVGDLWFKDANSDIMTCIVSRSSGSYTASDWSKQNKYTDNSALNDFISNQFANLETQVDGKIETFAQSSDPSTEWKTTDVKNQHKGDLWFNTNSNQTKRWTGTAWELLNIDPPQGVFDKIDGKAQVFVGADAAAVDGVNTRPQPPYYVNDLWFLGTDGGIKTCIRTRTTGNYNAGDWAVRNNYVDSTTAGSIAQGKVDAQTQAQILDKLTGGGKDKGLYLQNNELYINATFIKTGTISANIIQGGKIQDSIDSPKNTWNLATGEFVSKKGTIGGMTIADNSIYNSMVKLGNAGLYLRDNGEDSGRLYCSGDVLWIKNDNKTVVVGGSAVGKGFTYKHSASSDKVTIGASSIEFEGSVNFNSYAMTGVSFVASNTNGPSNGYQGSLGLRDGNGYLKSLTFNRGILTSVSTN